MIPDNLVWVRRPYRIDRLDYMEPSELARIGGVRRFCRVVDGWGEMAIIPDETVIV